jgi:tripartite-type tricarboxylate transporter receptor subunit TctC
MTMTKSLYRSSCLLLGAMVLALPAWSQAQAWPAKPVRVVVAFTAGGTTDILARYVGQQLADKLKQPFVIDNRPGAGGNLGTELVVRAPADGYTLTVNSVGPIAVNATLYPKLAYNPLTELARSVRTSCWSGRAGPPTRRARCSPATACRRWVSDCRRRWWRAC